MTTSPVVSVTDELIAVLDAESMHDDATDVHVSAVDLRALLAERAELRRDAERYRWLRVSTAENESLEPHGLCVELWDCGTGHEINGEQLDAAIDAAMQS